MNTLTNGQKPSALAERALRHALAQLGVREDPKKANTGEQVDKYLAAVGLKPGYAWCQAFVNWSYEQAANDLSVPEPVVNTGGVLDCWNRTDAKKKIAKAALLKNPWLILPGDQFIMKIGTKGAGHTGLVVSCQETAAGYVLTTIEGNTDDEGGREGIEVATRKRLLTAKEIVGIIRY